MINSPGGREISQGFAKDAVPVASGTPLLLTGTLEEDVSVSEASWIECSRAGPWQGFAHCCDTEPQRCLLLLLLLVCAAVLARLCISKACVLTATSRQFLKHRADKLPGVTTASLLSYFPGTWSHVSLACQPLSAAGDQMKQPCKLVQAIWLPTGAQGNEYTCWEPECWWQEFLLKTCKFPTQVLPRITSRMCFLACFHNEVSCVCRRKCCSWCHLASNQLLFRVRIILQWFQYILLKQMQL